MKVFTLYKILFKVIIIVVLLAAILNNSNPDISNKLKDIVSIVGNYVAMANLVTEANNNGSNGSVAENQNITERDGFDAKLKTAAKIVSIATNDSNYTQQGAKVIEANDNYNKKNDELFETLKDMRRRD